MKLSSSKRCIIPGRFHFSLGWNSNARAPRISALSIRARNVSINFGGLYVDRVYRFHARRIDIILDRFAATSAASPDNVDSAIDIVRATLSRAITLGAGILHVRASLTHANNAHGACNSLRPMIPARLVYLPRPRRFDGAPSTKWKFARVGTGK